MKKVYLLLSLFSLLFLAACGGDGNSLSYTGSSAPASISTTNAETFVVEGLSSTSTTAGANNTSSGVGNKARSKALAYAKSKAMSLSEGLMMAPQSYSDSEAGPCGGSLSFNAIVDDVTFDMSISATFSNYCVDNVTLSGSMNMQMILNSSTSEITVNMSFDNLTVVDGADSFTMSGTMVSQGLLASSMTLNMIMLDNKNNEQVKLENFIVSTGSSAVEFSGRMYHSVHGYVDVTTPTPMSFDSSGYMTSGSLKFSGASSSAILSATTEGGYQLEIDENGDGVIDLTQTGAWSELSSDALFASF